MFLYHTLSEAHFQFARNLTAPDLIYLSIRLSEETVQTIHNQ